MPDVVLGDACLHCGRAIDAAAAWQVADAVVGPERPARPERPLGVLQRRLHRALPRSAEPRRRRRLTAPRGPPTRQRAESARRRRRAARRKNPCVALATSGQVAPSSSVVLQQRRNYSSHTDAELARAVQGPRASPAHQRVARVRGPRRAARRRRRGLHGARGDPGHDGAPSPAAAGRGRAPADGRAAVARHAPGGPALRYVLTDLGTEVLPLLHSAAAAATPPRAAHVQFDSALAVG